MALSSVSSSEIKRNCSCACLSSITTAGKDGKPITTTSSYSVPGTSNISNHFDHEHLENYRPNIRTYKNIPRKLSPLVPLK